MKDGRSWASGSACVEEIAAVLIGNWREEHVFALGQALELYDAYQAKITACDSQTAAVLTRMRQAVATPVNRLPPARRRDKTANAPSFDPRAALHAVLGVDLTQIHGLGPSLALKLVGECGTEISAWPDAKQFLRKPPSDIGGDRARMALIATT